MMIREFYAKFSSKDESSSLFEVLRRLSRLDSIAGSSDPNDPDAGIIGWVGWPPNGGDVPQGLAPAEA